MNTIGRFLGRVHSLLGRSAAGAHIALKVRNQCDAVVRARLSDGPNADRNGELLLIRQVAPRARFFVDVGANVGNWAKSFLQLMPAEGGGLLFEPSGHTAMQARENLQQYMARLDLVEAAVGDIPGEGIFFAEPQHGESSSMVPGFSRPGASPVGVRITTLDEELEKRGITFVDFLKVDAEGFDLRVLKGARRALKDGRVGIVQFEYNAPWASAGSTLADAVSFLQGFGYQVFLLKADGLHRCDYRRYGEYFGYSNYVAVLPRQREMVASLLGGDI